VAQLDSGVYCGEIIGETDLHVVQRLTGKSAVAHMKHALGPLPEEGEQVLITYSHGHGRVQNIPVRDRGKELGR
jgi:hypothetical protein